ncbi:hypothetical protein M2387_001163 [Klebsiella sp. BIGb0407]|nr:hypothetical protein [Klebsiella sp. BIGb0407]
MPCYIRLVSDAGNLRVTGIFLAADMLENLYKRMVLLQEYLQMYYGYQ